MAASNPRKRSLRLAEKRGGGYGGGQGIVDRNDVHARNIQIRRAQVEKHERDFPFEEIGHHAQVRQFRRHDESAHAVTDEFLDECFLAFFVAVAVAEHGTESAQLRGLVDGERKFAVIRVYDARHQHPDHRGVPGLQLPRDLARRIGKLPDALFDALDGRLPQMIMAIVEVVGNAGNRYAGLTGDVLNGGWLHQFRKKCP